jgi:hypothetical protein
MHINILTNLKVPIPVINSPVSPNNGNGPGLHPYQTTGGLDRVRVVGDVGQKIGADQGEAESFPEKDSVGNPRLTTYDFQYLNTFPLNLVLNEVLWEDGSQTLFVKGGCTLFGKTEISPLQNDNILHGVFDYSLLTCL